jgi:hypothetical protein
MYFIDWNDLFNSCVIIFSASFEIFSSCYTVFVHEPGLILLPDSHNIGDSGKYICN